MKQRRPWFNYLLVWLSGGLFWFVWPFLMARDVNCALRDYIPRLRMLTNMYGTIATLHVGLIAYEMHRVATYTLEDGQPFQVTSGSYIALLLALAFLLFALPAYLAARTARFLRVRGRSAFGNFSSIALFICYGISLPLLQSKLNEEWKAQSNSVVSADAAR